MAAVQEVTDATFEQEVIQSPQLVLVDFWSPACPACVALAPILDKLAGEMADYVKFLKLNVFEHQATTAKYGIQSIPSLLIFKGGKVLANLVGFKPEHEIRRHLLSAIRAA